MGTAPAGMRLLGSAIRLFVQVRSRIREAPRPSPWDSDGLKIIKMSESTITDVQSGTSDNFRGHDSETVPGRESESRSNETHAFWDPRVRELRKAYLKVIVRGTITVILAIWAFLPIYWGAVWKTSSLTSNVKGWVVDLDGDQVGQAVVQTFQGLDGIRGQLGWNFYNTSNTPGGIVSNADFENALVQNQAWVAVVINQGATRKLLQAINVSDSAYDGSSAVTVYANQARNENAFSQLIVPAVQTPLITASSVFARQLASQIATRQNAAQILSQAPQIVTQPLYFTINNVRPFDVPVAVALTFVGLIFLIIFSFVITMMNYNARSPLENKLKLGSLIAIRLAIPFIAYFFVATAIALVSLAFQVPFNRQFGHAGFVVYWALCYCAMLALGLAIEALITILKPRFVPFFLVLWVISNVSIASVAFDEQPSIYKYGYAMPFYNVSAGVRCILFRTRNQLGLNFGVLFAWIAVSLVTIPLFTALVRRREIRRVRKLKELARAGTIEEGDVKA